jgi:hypothetical protein
MEAVINQPIDTVAHAALMTCDEPIGDIVARLSSKGRTSARSPLYGRIHVSRPKGVVSVKFDTRDGVTWVHGRIVVRGRPRPDGMDRHTPHEGVNAYVGHGFLVDGTRINSMVDAHGGGVVWINVRSPVRSI